MAQMAIIQRRFDLGNNPATGAPKVMIFDSVLREAHRFAADITDNPVETGVALVDHAIMKPHRPQLDVVVSDTPLIFDPSGQYTPSVQLATTFAGSARRSANALDALLELMASFLPFTVVTGLHGYPNMLIESIDAEQTKDSAGKLHATVSLKEAKFATTVTVVYPPRGPKKTRRAAAPVADKGKNEAEEPATATPSWLSQLFGVGAVGIRH
jgi:hypothetical protein